MTVTYCYICNREMEHRWACDACVLQFHMNHTDWQRFLSEHWEERYSPSAPVPSWVQQKYPHCHCTDPDLMLDEGI